jgi:hypothetical protein
MRTTVSLDKDVEAAVRRLRKQRNIGLSAAVNELARAGLAASTERKRFVQRSVAMGAGSSTPTCCSTPSTRAVFITLRRLPGSSRRSMGRDGSHCRG